MIVIEEFAVQYLPISSKFQFYQFMLIFSLCLTVGTVFLSVYNWLFNPKLLSNFFLIYATFPAVFFVLSSVFFSFFQHMFCSPLFSLRLLEL